MAISWGTPVGTSQVRVGIDISQSPSTVYSADSSVVLTVKYYVQALENCNDNQKLTISGDIDGGPYSYSLQDEDGALLVKSATLTVNTSFTGTVTKSFTATVSDYWSSGTPTATRSWTVAKRPYYTPNAPDTVTATRGSATSITVGWDCDASSSSPYHNTYIQRSDNDGAWATVHTITTDYTAAASLTWADTTVNGTTKYKYRVQVSNTSGTVTSAASAYATVAPYAPSGVIATPNIDGGTGAVGSVDITFSLPTTTTAPYAWTGSYVERWNSSTNSWTRVTTLVGTATTWTDTSVSPDTGYQYRVQSYNVAGTSAFATGNTVYTQPYAPTGPVSSTKLALSAVDDDITLTWVNPSTIETGTIIEWSQDSGSTWTSLVTVAANSTSYTVNNVDKTKTHRFRVRNQSGGGVLSAWLYSDPLTLIQPPAAPKLAGSFYNRTDYIDVNDVQCVAEWTHNPLDGTAQTAYELEISSDNWATKNTSGKVSTVNTRHILSSVSNGKTIKWHVRTWGAHTDPSPWSADGIFKTSAKPTLTLTTPKATNFANNPATDTYPSLNLTVVHTYTDAEGKAQAAHRTVLLNEDKTLTLADVTENNANLSATLAYQLTNNTNYVIRKYVKDADGLWSTVLERTFRVSRDNPPNTPDAPTSITVTKNSDTDQSITWGVPGTASGAIGTNGAGGNGWSQVVIERWDNVTQKYNALTTVSYRNAGTYAAATLPYHDTTTEANRQYKYRVRADAIRQSDSDATIYLTASSGFLEETGTIYTTPGAPQNLMAQQPNDNVILTWNNTTSYTTGVTIKVDRKASTDSAWTSIATINGEQTTYTDTTTAEDTTYSYRVRTVNGTMTSAWATTARSIKTKSTSAATLYAMNIPPVRRRGPRESVKENIEAAELAAIIETIKTELATLNTQMTSYHASMSVYFDDMAAGMEAAKSKTDAE